MKRLARFCVVVLGLLVLSGALAFAQSDKDKLTKLIEEAKPAVLQVIIDSSKKHEVGTAFFVNASGGAVTCAHVVGDKAEVKVKLYGDRNAMAKVVYKDEASDIAILQVAVLNSPALVLADSSKVKQGEQVVVIGAPFALTDTATSGIVSALPDPAKKKPYLQTDAAVNPGNSGGPLLNMQGEVIGMINSILKNAEGIGFAVPSNTVLKVLKEAKVAALVAPSNTDFSLQVEGESPAAKDKTPKESPLPSAPGEAPPAPAKTNPAVYLLGIFILMAIGAALTWYFLSRAPKTPQATSEPEGPEPEITLHSTPPAATPPPAEDDLDDVDIELH